MDHNYEKKLKHRVNSAFINRIDNALKARRNLEAALLVSGLIEHLMRLLVKLRLIQQGRDPSQSRFEKYWSNEEMVFTRLVDYYEVAGGESVIVDDARNYYKARGSVFHGIFTRENLKQLSSDARENAEYGMRLKTKIDNQIEDFYKWQESQ